MNRFINTHTHTTSLQSRIEACTHTPIHTPTHPLTSDAVTPGQEGEAEYPIRELHDDTKDLEQIDDLIGYAVDPHNRHGKTKPRKRLQGNKKKYQHNINFAAVECY